MEIAERCGKKGLGLRSVLITGKAFVGDLTF